MKARLFSYELFKFRGMEHGLHGYFVNPEQLNFIEV